MKSIERKEAIHKIKNGFPIIFQTDTLPAIGCMPEYYEKIYDIKKRDRNKALILMGAHLDQLIKYVHNSAVDDFEKVAIKYWPGAITFIVPISDSQNLNFITTKNTIGLRIPNLDSAKDFIKNTGPLLTSSANISGFITSTTAKEVSMDLPKIDLLGPIPWDICSGRASTIVSWISKGKWRLIRKGQVSISEC